MFLVENHAVKQHALVAMPSNKDHKISTLFLYKLKDGKT
jgi:hypothetical protein